MNVGERFAVAGYDLVASAQCCHGGGPPDTGEFIVLNNNSTHYLVARRVPGEPSAVLDGFSVYHTEDDAPQAYVEALQLMVSLVMMY